jgi:hypothetical protein
LEANDETSALPSNEDTDLDEVLDEWEGHDSWVEVGQKERIRIGVLHVRSGVAFGRGLWLRMKVMRKELGNGGITPLEGYDIVNQWSLAGDVDELFVVRGGRGM